jgi:hypothetical protein
VKTESAQTGALDDSGEEVRDKSTEAGGHGAETLTGKQRKRISGVTIEGKLAVRGPGYEPFDFAATLGKGMAPGGTFRTLLPGEVAICVVVPPSTRDRVLELAGITPRAWRSYVRKWEDDCMAHRCAHLGRGSVTLFYYPHAVCSVPACGEFLPPERKQRAVQVEAAFRMNGSSVPRNVLNTGDASRDEQGDAPLLVPRVEGPRVSDASQGSFDIAARIVRERELGLADQDIAALLNQSEAFTPPAGFVRWTGYAVRVSMGEATHAA